jgi:hypothetical protein
MKYHVAWFTQFVIIKADIIIKLTLVLDSKRAEKFWSTHEHSIS